MSIKAITIPADTTGDITYSDHPGDLTGLQESVGGWVEAVGNGEITVWMDEEGKISGKAPNFRATKIAHLLSLISPLDTIAGDAVITGGPDDEGETTSASIETLGLLD